MPDRDKSKPNPVRGESARNILGLFTIVKLAKAAEEKADEGYTTEEDDGVIYKG